MESQFILGNCFDILPKLNKKSFDAIIIDPPYGIGVADWDKPIDIFTFTEQVARLGKDFYAFFGQMPTMIDWINAASRSKLKYREHITWVKRKTTPTGKLSLNKGFENIFIYRHKNKTFKKVKGNYSDVTIPKILYDVNVLVSMQKWSNEFINQIKTKNQEDIISFQKGQPIFSPTRLRRVKNGRKRNTTSNYTNVWSFLPPTASAGRTSKSIYYHPCEKPVELLKRLVELLTPEKGIVLDPFAGSGSTALACLETGRQYFCIENNEIYYKTAIARMAKWTSG
jgi:site-specific DNA-methyltransferase (adenine-specific)